MAKNTSILLKRLRSLMKDTSIVSQPLHAYIVPSGDAHQSEYLAPRDQRRVFLSGFTGSAGTAVVTNHHACMWTDGRYFVQCEKELDSNWTLMKEGLPATLTQGEWLSKNLPLGSKVGVDPTLLSQELWNPLSKALHSAGHELVPVYRNLVDIIWEDRPDPVENMIEPLSIEFTGLDWENKIEEVCQKMEEKGASLLVISALDDTAWLLNLRGSDIQFNPVFFAYSCVTVDRKLHLFVEREKITLAVRRHLGLDNMEDVSETGHVNLHPYENILSWLQDAIPKQSKKVWIGDKSSFALTSCVPEHLRVSDPSPVTSMKAIKNAVELQGFENAHIKDAAALCCFFAWLEDQVQSGKEVTEMSASARLELFRQEQENHKGPSFETISASGPNGAVIHYKPAPETDRAITTEELYLCDSGAQYLDGTTDVTRTIHLGTPTDHEKDCFTRVFKGHVALAACIFPTKIKGNCLDTIARLALWKVGLDYLHGTGHGVGHYLCVHEGPMGISWRVYPDDPGLQAGMVLSDEPGYYEDGKFGIRIENLVKIVPANTKYNFKDRGFLTFEPLTLVPIQTKMLNADMLTKEEIDYLENYHQLCRDKVGPLLKRMGKEDGLKWLLREAQSIS